jgi:hypothetical protein
MIWKKREAQRNGDDGKEQHAPAGALRQPRTIEFYPGTPDQYEQDDKTGQRQFNEIAGREADWIFEGQSCG